MTVVACGGGKGNYSSWIEGEIRAMHEGAIVGAAAAPEGEGEKARRWSTRREVDGRAGARRADERDSVQDARTAQSQNETSFRVRTNAQAAAARRHACG
jgi:hypothetical protein